MSNILPFINVIQMCVCVCVCVCVKMSLSPSTYFLLHDRPINPEISPWGKEM